MRNFVSVLKIIIVGLIVGGIKWLYLGFNKVWRLSYKATQNWVDCNDFVRPIYKLVATSEKMAKPKNLNGLPNNLAKSYLSTLGYYDGGYMPDWINYIAREKNVTEIEIDILNKTVKPEKANIKPLVADLEKLKNIIQAELKNNGFKMSFIKKAIMRFEIPINSPNINPVVYCYPHLEDENGKIYKPKNRIAEVAYEVSFNPVKKVRHSIMEKIRRLIR